MAQPVRILILGTGGMATNHADKFKEIEGVTLVGGVDTRPEQLRAFCDQHGIAKGFASLDEALAWGEFDAVTNVTPDAAHFATTMPILKAGKHILCEKPLATNEAHADEMAATAAEAGVINMVNLSYRNVAALQQGAKLVRDGAIGTIRHFEASYLQSWRPNLPGAIGTANRNGCGGCRPNTDQRGSWAMSVSISLISLCLLLG